MTPLSLHTAQGPSASCKAKTSVRVLSQAGREAVLDRHNTLRRRSGHIRWWRVGQGGLDVKVIKVKW